LRQQVVTRHDFPDPMLLQLSLDPGDQGAGSKRVQLNPPPAAKESNLLGRRAVSAEVVADLAPVAQEDVFGPHSARLDVLQAEGDVEYLDRFVIAVAPVVPAQRADDG